MAWPTVVVDTTNMDAAGDNPGNARAAIKQMADNVNAIKDSKGVASGIAELDVGGKVPVAQVPTIPANQGGTGQTAFAVGDIFYANTTSTLTKLAAGSAGTVLTSGGPGAAPSWAASGGGLSSGTRMSFNQTAAPTGWTKDTTAALNDSIMRIVTGTVGSGGSNAFSTFNGQTSVGATTLALSQIPSHSHSQHPLKNGTTGTYAVDQISGASPFASNTGAQGGGGSHTHTITTAIKYNDFIIASKN